MFDTFDNGVQGVDTDEVIREADDRSVDKFAKKLRDRKIEVVEKDPTEIDKGRTLEDKIRSYLPSR